MISLKEKYSFFWLLLLVYYIVNVYSLWQISSIEGVVKISSDRGFFLNQTVGGILILASAIPLLTYWARILQVELFQRIFIFLLFLLFYAVFFSMREGLANIASLSKVYVWMLAIFPFFIFFLQAKNLKNVQIFVITVLIYILLNIIISLRTFALDDSLSGANIGAYLLTIVPLCFLFFRTKTFIWLLLFCVILALISGKRMAVLGMGLMIIFFLKDLWHQFSKKGITVAIVIAMLIILLFPYIEPYIDRMLERNALDQERGSYGSGRSVIFPIIWSSFSDGNLLEIFFGHGVGATAHLIAKTYGIEIAAHNAFLELLYNYGILGVALYLSLFASLVKLHLWFKNNGNKKYAKALLANIIIWVLLSLVSHGFVGIAYIPMAVIWAFLISKKVKIIKYKKNRIN
jgi:O-antigen ligase